MKYSRYLIALIAILVFSLGAFFLIYDEAKKQTIADLNFRQMVHARQAAKSIQDRFLHMTEMMKILSMQDHIIRMDENGKRIMAGILKTLSSDIRGVTRMDARGKILHLVPYNATMIGRDISGQDHVREALKTHATVISDVFPAVQGFRSIAVHVPVFRNGAFDGTIAFLISFDDFTKKYLEDIRIGRSGYAWVISRGGIELYDPVPGNAGRSIFETGKDFPDLLAMCREMVKGKEGVTTYHYNRIRDSRVDPVLKHAVYLPIRFDNTFWSIAVSTPDSEVTALMEGFTTRLIVMTLVLFLICVVLTFLLLHSFVLIREQRKRRSVEEALRLEHRKLRDIIEFFPEPVFVIDQDKKITAWNRAMEEMTGVGKAAMLGRGDYEYALPLFGARRPILIDLVDGPDPEEEAKYKYVRRQGDAVFAESFIPSLHGGKGAHLWGIAVPLRDREGKRYGAVEAIRDITELVNKEEALEKERAALEVRVAERTAELSRAKERAEAADRLKSAFLATMSHELRTPLNSIIGFTGIILQGIVGPLNDEQKKQLTIVRGSAQHLLSLINDVLDISKIEAGQLQIAWEQIDLRRTIEKAVESARPLSDKKELELAYEIAPGVGTITGDQRRLEQVLLNLIGNAVKFTESGRIRVECEPRDGHVQFRVIDTGIGIRAEDLGSIFEAFRQVDSGMTRKYDGTGLGLSICKKLVELMGGEIRVESVWGSGSTFSFSLPKERQL